MPPQNHNGEDIVTTIRRCVDEEKKNPPVPKTYEDIPVSFDAITPEWLTATLGRDAAAGTIVKSFKLGPTDNGSYNRRHITLSWDGPDADKMPPSIFCKAAHDLENRIVLSHGSTYSEVTFYREIRQNLDIEAPTTYYAAYDPVSWVSMVILQDMSSGATFCTHKTPLSKDQFAQQVQILAKLHGEFYQSRVPVFNNLMAHKERFESLHATLDLKTVCTNGFRAAKSVIPPRLFARESEIWPATVRSVERNGSLPETIVHCDVHLGNWYITDDGRMGLTDWQAMSRGHWSRDLAYLLGTAVPTEKRRLWERDMVKLYVAEFEKAGGPGTTEEEAWLELRRQAFGALWYWTFTLTPSTIMPDMQTEATTLDFIGRISALIDDHDALDAFDF